MLCLVGLLVVSMVIPVACALYMPGVSVEGNAADYKGKDTSLSLKLKSDVEMLCNTIGERNYLHPEALEKSREFLAQSFREMGLPVTIQKFKAGPSVLATIRGANQKNTEEITFTNIIAEVRGTEHPGEYIVVGAHYDTAPCSGNLGADDNASGVAGVLALARHFSKNPQKRTIRFVCFANEEPPFFWTHDMGSYVCARESRRKKEIVHGMITLECIGYFSEEAGTQQYPPLLEHLFDEKKGNFIAFVGGSMSGHLVRKSIASFRKEGLVPSKGAVIPLTVPGIGWSDHWSYAQFGYPAMMITDTATYRNPNYHTRRDVPLTLDYRRMELVVEGCKQVICDLAEE